jgi:hypothetical protein
MFLQLANDYHHVIGQAHHCPVLAHFSTLDIPHKDNFLSYFHNFLLNSLAGTQMTSRVPHFPGMEKPTFCSPLAALVDLIPAGVSLPDPDGAADPGWRGKARRLTYDRG